MDTVQKKCYITAVIIINLGTSGVMPYIAKMKGAMGKLSQKTLPLDLPHTPSLDSGLKEQAQERVIRILNGFLGSEYVYIRHFVMPEPNINEVDGILIGPKGIFIIEVNDWAGDYRVNGRDIFRVNKLRGDSLVDSDLVESVVKKQGALKALLEGDEVNAFPRSLVVMANGQVKFAEGKSEVFFTNPDRLADYIQKFPDKKEFDSEFTDSVARALGKDY